MNAVRIVYDVEGWAYAHTATALRKYSPSGFQVSTAPFKRPDGSSDAEGAIGDTPMDLLYVMMNLPHSARQLHKAVWSRGWRPRIVGGWNAGWPLGIESFPERYREADLLIVNNHTAWDRLGRLPRTTCCPVGVDLDLFRITTPLEIRQPRVLWVGSELQREIKGYDDHLVPLQQRLTALGTVSDFRLVDSCGNRKSSQEEMAEWYNTGTVLVCASQTEGTPNPALEAAACGCVIVSTPVGNMTELIRNGENGYLVERTVDGLLAGIVAAIAGYRDLATQLQRDIQDWGWHAQSRAFFEAFRRALDSRPLPPASG